jgi:hypothetical protein
MIELLKPNVLYGVREEWFQTFEGRKLIAETSAHNYGILTQLFGQDAFLEHDPALQEAPTESVSCIQDSGISPIDNEPLNADATTESAKAIQLPNEDNIREQLK